MICPGRSLAADFVSTTDAETRRGDQNEWNKGCHKATDPLGTITFSDHPTVGKDLKAGLPALRTAGWAAISETPTTLFTSNNPVAYEGNQLKISELVQAFFQCGIHNAAPN